MRACSCARAPPPQIPPQDDRAARREANASAHRSGAAFYARTDRNATDREHYGRPAPFSGSTSTFTDAYPTSPDRHDAQPVAPARRENR